MLDTWEWKHIISEDEIRTMIIIKCDDVSDKNSIIATHVMIVFMSPTHIGVTILNFDIAVVSNSCGSNIRIARGNNCVALSALRSYQIFAIRLSVHLPT